MVSTVTLLAFDWTAASAGLGGVIVGVILGVVIMRTVAKGMVTSARTEADAVRQRATSEADAIRQKAELDAERAAGEKAREVEAEVAQSRKDIKDAKDRLDRREDSLEKKADELGARASKLDKRQTKMDSRSSDQDAREASLAQRDVEMTHAMAEVAQMTMEEAKATVLERVADDARHDAATVRREIIEQAQTDARKESREITLMAIQRFASEHVADSTVRSVKIPSDDMKGRIIGREGRNIRAIERATGADILVDDTPGVIAVSCFDPIRRAIAGEALSKLVSDGRVHPSRIEEMVESVRAEMEERIAEKGNEAVVEAKIQRLNPRVVEAMGKLHFRTSFGQNVLRHSIEVAYLSQVIADQLGLDGKLARRCGFLHDIGKAMDHEMEGGHPAIGMEFAKRYGEKNEAVLNAIGGHHGDIPATSPYTPIVMAADAVSGARPGARRESMERYVQRLEQLEGIAKDSGPVREAFAIQAGREIRVIVDSGRVNDDEALVIADRIARRVEDEMTFPGEIKVTVLRETRAEATAR